MSSDQVLADSETPQPEQPLLVVGLGASAGGIQALQGFFSEVAPDSGAAFVVILHLSPEHDSRLAEVLQTSTRMPVTQVTETRPLEPNHVYVISPRTSLRMADGVLTVSDVLRHEERRAPVDVFFRTLADAHGSRAVGVVLSGTGSDGSSGIRRLKEYGGLAIVQDPSEAAHDDMPRRALASGLIDYVLPVRQMAARIAQYVPLAHAPLPHATDSAPAPDVLRGILALLRVRTGQDFSNYKMATLQRRIERRRHLHGLADLEAYATFLRRDPDEPSALLRELLISVTSFFRDPDAFQAVEREVIPRLFQNRGPSVNVRVWVAGCATGEEAYSIGMLLVEAAERLHEPPPIQVFATDLDARAIAMCREGLYTDVDTADLSPERLRRFFSREAGGYRVRRELRELVLFARHNVLKDPPFSHMDLICCRNLLIYLNRTAQDQLLETFHFALRPGRYLFLGAAESTSGSELFGVLDRDARISESRMGSARSLVPRIEPAMPRELGEPTLRPAVLAPASPERMPAPELHLQLLEQFAPPSIVVTADYQIVHMSEHAGRFLRLAGGEPTRELLKLVRPDLRVDLRSGLYRAAHERSIVRVQSSLQADGEGLRPVVVEVRPILHDGDPVRGLFLVVFIEPSDDPAAERADILVVRPGDGGADSALHLEEELSRVRRQLRATVDQYETQAEEARASNEELQAINEELRSSAEELETSKEELQSLNEELTTVNQELKVKIDELGTRNNDFWNLISSTDIATLFLDRQLRIRFSTPGVREVFNVLPNDIGRALSDITSSLRYDGLALDIAQVLDRLNTLERELQTDAGRWFLLRVLPYRTTEERIDGVVLTFQDISARRRAEEAARVKDERLRLVAESIRDYAILTITPEGAISWWNAGAANVFGYTAEQVLGQQVDVLFTPEDRAAGVPAAELDRARKDGRAEDERWHLRKDGSRFYCSGVTTPLRDVEGGFAKIARDLTPAREAQQALERAHKDLEDRVRERTHALEHQIAERGAAEAHARALVRRVVSAQEEERARIARDIHDHIGGQLTALRLALDRVREHCRETPDIVSELDQVLGLAQGIDHEIDFLAWELRPAALDDLGLVAALSRYLESWSRHAGVHAEFRTEGFDNSRLDREVETTYYRVAQEAINNVAKHAHAHRVDVILEKRDGVVVLVVEDDGVGFESEEFTPPATGVGIAGMHERALLIGAELQVESTPGHGTTVILRHRGGARSNGR